MSNRRKLAKEKDLRLKCPKCGGRSFSTKEYDDAWLHICENDRCQYPQRVVKKDVA